MSTKILVNAEWRIGSGSLDSAREQVERSVSVALDSGVGLYVFAGGLASKNSPLVHHASALAVDVARRLKSKGIPSLWLAGAADRVPDGQNGTTLGALDASGFGQVITEPTLLHADGPDNPPEVPQVVALPYGPYNPARWLQQTACKMKATKRARALVIGALPVGVNTAAPDVTFPARECQKWFPQVTMFAGHHAEAEERQGVTLLGSLASGELTLLEL